MIPGKKYLHGTSAPVLPDASNLTTQSSVVRLDAPCHTVLQQFFYHRNILHIGICSTTRTGTFYKYTESRMETSYFEYSDNHLMLSALSSSFWFHTFTPLSHANFNCPFVSSVILLGLHIGFLSATHISGRFSLTSAAGIGGHTAFPHLFT